MLTEFLEASMNSNAEMDFYDKATAIIKDANEAEDVLIYLKNEAKFELKRQNYEFKDEYIYRNNRYGESVKFKKYSLV